VHVVEAIGSCRERHLAIPLARLGADLAAQKVRSPAILLLTVPHAAKPSCGPRRRNSSPGVAASTAPASLPERGQFEERDACVIDHSV
jgi:hypothetical protein